MGKGNFSDEFNRDAADQITERGYLVSEVSQRIGGECSFVLCVAREVRFGCPRRHAPTRRVRTANPNLAPNVPTERGAIGLLCFTAE